MAPPPLRVEGLRPARIGRLEVTRDLKELLSVLPRQVAPDRESGPARFIKHQRIVTMVLMLEVTTNHFMKYHRNGIQFFRCHVTSSSSAAGWSGPDGEQRR